MIYEKSSGKYQILWAVRCILPIRYLPLVAGSPAQTRPRLNRLISHPITSSARGRFK